MKVGEIMSLEVEYARPQDNVQRAAELMRDLDVGMLPIVEREAVVGVVTDRDIAVRFAAAGLDYAGTSVTDVMSREVFYCYEDQELAEASRLMERKRVRRLIVLDRDNKLVGVVSLADLARTPFAGALPALETVFQRGERREAPAGDALNALIRDELAAAETYRQAGERVHGPAIAELQRLEAEHRQAAAALQATAAERGQAPATSSGAWGVWSRLVERAASLVGEETALRALIEGEFHGVEDYEQALRDRELPAEVRALIQTDLLPQTREHIPALQSYVMGRHPRGSSYNADQGYGPSGSGRGVA